MLKVAVFITALLLTAVPVFSGEIFVQNCTLNYTIGVAKFNDDITDYKILPELRVEAEGVKVWNLKPGVYGITYRNNMTGGLGFEMTEVTEDSKDNLLFKCNEKSEL